MSTHETYRMDIVVDVADGEAKVELKSLDKALDSTKKSGDALGKTDVTPKVDSKARTELTNAEKVMVSAKKRADALGKTRVNPTVSMQDKLTSPLKKIESNLKRISNKPHKIVLEGVDKATGVVKRIISTLTSPLTLIGMGGGALGAGALIRDFFMTAGRTETLNIAMESVARSTNTPLEELIKQRQNVMNLGIAEQEASQVMTRFMQGNLDIAQAAKVARVAQNAAVIAGVNSSEATETIVEAIAKLSPELLTAFGMTKNMNDIFSEHAKRIGIVVETTDKYGKTVRHMTRDLTEAEKKQAMLSYVLEEGAKIAGTYEGAMGSAFKKMGSLTRYWTDFKTKVGAPLFLAAFGAGIDALTDAFKRSIEWTKNNQHVLEQWGKSIEGSVSGTIERVKNLLGRLANDEAFREMNWGDKLFYLLDIALDEVVDWLDGSGGKKVEEMFTKLGSIAGRAWIAALKGTLATTVKEAGSGNLFGALAFGGMCSFLGGGLLLKGGLEAGKAATRGGRWIGKNIIKNPAAKTAPILSPGVTTAGEVVPILSSTGKITNIPIGAAAEGTGLAGVAGRAAGVGSEALSMAGGALSKVGRFAGRAAWPVAIGAGVLEIASERTPAEKIAKTAEVGGGLAGALAGGKLGAAIGTAIAPGIGTAIGGILGGLGGYIGGRKIGGSLVNVKAAEAGEVTASPAVKADMGNLREMESFQATTQATTQAMAPMELVMQENVAIMQSFNVNLQDKATEIIARMGTWSEQTWTITGISTAFAANLQDVADNVISNGWSLVGALSNAASRARSFVLPSFSGAPAVPHAAGGIFSSPHLGLVAEAGPEAVIPLSKRMRSRGLELLQQVGGYFGGSSPAPAFAGGGLGLSQYLDGSYDCSNNQVNTYNQPVTASNGDITVSVPGVKVNIHMPTRDIDEDALARTIGYQIIKPIINALENKV